MAIQLIINREWGLAKNENPNQGAFIIDELTELVEEAVLKEFERIAERGGVLGAMETGYQRGKIQEESMHYEMLKHTGEYPIVGVNTFRNPHGDPVPQTARAGALDRRREAVAAQAPGRLPRPPRGRGAGHAQAPAGGGDREPQRVRGADGRRARAARSARSRTRCSRSAGSTGAACRRHAMGPLSGLRVLEFEAIGPAPFGAMLLADMGADVLLVDRPTDSQLGLGRERHVDVMLRGRRSVTLDLKSAGGAEAARLLADRADVVVEGFRPGVMERLGLGPDQLLESNPRLVYARMTGWGQEGPLAARAGHDINYIALTGALHAIGRAGESPVPPLNLVGDFGGGGMMLAFGIACAVIEARASGRGQVVDTAMVDGAALLSTMFAGMLASGRWSEERGANALDGGAPWYDTYVTLDGKYVAIGAIEPKFYSELIQRLGLGDADLPTQHERPRWPELRAAFATAFASKTRDEWCSAFAGSDACFAPVLTFSEARADPHALARGAYQRVGDIDQPAVAPRFMRTPGATRGAPPQRGEGGHEALESWGFDADAIGRLEGLGLGLGSAGDPRRA